MHSPIVVSTDRRSCQSAKCSAQCLPPLTAASTQLDAPDGIQTMPYRRRAAPPASLPCLIRILWAEPRRSGIEVEHVGQADHAAESTTQRSTGKTCSTDIGRRVSRRVRWPRRRLSRAREGGVLDHGCGIHGRHAWGWRHGRGRRRRIDDPHAVRAGSDEFRDGVREGVERSDMEDGEGIFAVIHATLGKDNGDEMNAARVEQRDGRRGSEKLKSVLTSRSLAQSALRTLTSTCEMLPITFL